MSKVDLAHSIIATHIKAIQNNRNKVQHKWKITTFLSVTLCHYCGEVIWGFSEQGVQCTVCNYASHHKCANKVASTCHIAEKHPVREHSFTPFSLKKPYFCNYCRTMIVILNPGQKCDVCRYVVHSECVAKAPKNCRCGLSTKEDEKETQKEQEPQKEKEKEKEREKEREREIHHHWVEGNTPQKSSCGMCGLSAQSVTSLIHFRCAWCKTVSHSSCLSKFTPYCDRGALGDSIVSPLAAIAPSPPSNTIKLVPDQLPPSPMFVFVNSKSGGQQGPRLLHKLKYLLNDQVQIFELIPGGPGAGLTVIQNYLDSVQNSNNNNNNNSDNASPGTPPTPTFLEGDIELKMSKKGQNGNNTNNNKGKKGKRGKRKGRENRAKGEKGIRIVVCGGDGTAGWVLQAMAERGMSFPLGVIPLGTGNDLARTLGWGPGYDGENVGNLLLDIADAKKKMLDRWNTTFTAFNGQNNKSVTMTNYFSIGVDAKVALSFHLQREASPEHFKNRFVNKLWYTKFGATAMFDGCENLDKDVTLEVDNKNIPIPCKLQGLIIVNLPSYASGVNTWCGPIPAGTQRQAIDDGILEVVGVLGSGHLGQIQAGLSDCLKITQGTQIKVSFVNKEGPYPVQVDGEPWLQEPGVIKIERRDQVPVLVNQDKSLIIG